MISDVTGCVSYPGRGLKGWVSDALVSCGDTLEYCDLVIWEQEVVGSNPTAPTSLFSHNLNL